LVEAAKLQLKAERMAAVLPRLDVHVKTAGVV